MHVAPNSSKYVCACNFILSVSLHLKTALKRKNLMKVRLKTITKSITKKKSLNSNTTHLKSERVRAIVNVAMICETNILTPPSSSSSSSSKSNVDRKNLVCKITYVAFSKAYFLCFYKEFFFILIIKMLFFWLFVLHYSSNIINVALIVFVFVRHETLSKSRLLF